MMHISAKLPSDARRSRASDGTLGPRNCPYARRSMRSVSRPRRPPILHPEKRGEENFPCCKALKIHKTGK